MRNNLLLGKIFVALILFFISLYYEQAASERFLVLSIIFIAYLCWGIARSYMGKYFWLFYVDAIFLLFLDYQSRFVVNYFIHSLYFLLIVEAGLVLNRKEINRTVLPVIVAALSKFIYLLYYDLNARTLSETLFHLLVFLFLLLIFQYLLLQKDERLKNKLLYDELLHTHRKLKQAMKKAEEVSLLKERNRIARDMHDSVGHELTGLIMMLETTALNLKGTKDVQKVETSIIASQEAAKKCLTETRNAVHSLQENTDGGIKALVGLIDKVKQTNNVEVDLTMDEKLEERSLSEEQSYTLYRVFQEAMTNVMKYGLNKEMKIIINDQHDSIHFRIENKTNASKAWTEGFGISNMKECIYRVNGKLDISIVDHTFVVEGFIPIMVEGT